jgi:hypothetical protein
MNDVQHLLERQVRWQKTRRALTWPEKIRMAEMVRESVWQLRAAPKAKLRGRYITAADAEALRVHLPTYVQGAFAFALDHGIRKGQLAPPRSAASSTWTGA